MQSLALNVPSTQPANFYTDINGHGTHCAGTMAGKNFGWAKNADLYNITLYSNSGNNISWENAVDAMIGWHTKKNNPSDPAYTGRPTVVNMSFGYSRYIWSGTPNQFSFSFTGTRYDIVGGTYQGTGHSDTTNLTGKGLPAFNNAGYAGIEGKFVSDDADVRSMINAGIHVCCAAGNSSLKMDVPGGTDYNNNIQILNSSNLHYYHRGGSPSAYEGGEVSNDGTKLNRELLKKYDLVVTTTGNVNVLDKFMLDALRSGCVICNIGHFDNEIDIKHLKTFDWYEVKPGVHKVRRSDKDYLLLLGEGRLVNLALATGHPSRVMDGSFCNQVLAQIALFKDGYASKNPNERELYVKVLPKKLDEEVAALMVQGFGGTLTKLTKKQQDYISVNEDGPFKGDSYNY